MTRITTKHETGPTLGGSRGFLFYETHNTTKAGASAFAPYPAPNGYHWEFVTSNSELVTMSGKPVISLVEN
jgi:hypothetical protein